MAAAKTPYEILLLHVPAIANPPSGFDLSAAVDEALQKGNVPTEHIRVLTFTKSLLQYGDNEWKTCKWLLQKINGPPLRKALGLLMFPRTAFDDLKKQSPPNLTTLGRVRIDFFQTQPLVAIQVLLEKTTEFSLPAAQKNLALLMLEEAIDGNVRLDSDQVLEVVEDKAKQANEGNLPANFRKDFDAALLFLSTVENLCRIAQDPQDVALLYRQKWQTIRRIATEQKDRFTDRFVQLGMTLDNAVAIHDAAQRVDCWNEHFWLTMMEARRKDFIPIEPRPASGKKPGDGMNNNLTDIFKLEDVACETCGSITSLAAYYTDLLSLLKQTSAGRDSRTLFDVLNERRPDLKYLQLSCANSQTLLPYLSLVNEVLESYIHYRYQLDYGDPNDPVQTESIIPWNTPEDALFTTDDDDIHSSQPTYQPGNTIEFVYSDIISQQMFPFTQFPYEKHRDEIAHILGGFGVSMLELVDAFKLAQHLLEAIPQETQDDHEVNAMLLRGVDEVFARQRAAEVLNIQQTELAAITGETFFPSWFVDLLNGLARPGEEPKFQASCSWETHKLWGYTTVLEMCDPTSRTRLSLVKEQLMRRSELEFQDILNLSKSQFFGQELVITNERGSAQFEESLEDLRLLMGSREPPYKNLTPEICFALQAFMRLRAKLNWTVRDLDAAIFAFRSLETRQASYSIHKPEAQHFFSISPFVIEGIASLVELSELSGLDPANLLPIWGAMDTFGSDSFIYRKFFTPSLRQVSKIFEPPKDSDMFLTIDGNTVLIRDEDGPICMSLGWPVGHFYALLQATNLSEIGLYLDVDNFSVLYRHVLICKILDIAPNDCVKFFGIFYAEQESPLEHPAKTLSKIRQWKTLLAIGWSVESLFDTLKGTQEWAENSSGPPPVKDGLAIISAITQGSQLIRNSFLFLFTNSEPNSADVAQCAAHAFDAVTAKAVVEFIEGTQVMTKEVAFNSLEELNTAIKESQKWPRKLTIVPNLTPVGSKYLADVNLIGTLTAAESKAIEELTIQPAYLKSATESLRKQSLAPLDIIESRFKKSPGANPTVLVNAMRSAGIAVATPVAEEDEEQILLQEEALKRERQSAFVKLASPTIVQELTETLVFNTVQELIPDLDPKLTPILLSDVVKVPGPEGLGPESALIALQRLGEPSDSPTTIVDAYFTPSTTETYTLSYEDDGVTPLPAAPSLSVNGILITYNKTSSSWSPFQMAGGQTYHLLTNFAPSHLQWATPKSMASTFTPEMLLPADKAQGGSHIMAIIRRAVNLCLIYGLSADELDYFGIPKTEIQRILVVDFTAPTFDLLIELNRYAEFRSKCKPETETDTTVSLLRWFARSTGFNKENIIDELTKCTGWKLSRMREAIDAKYAGPSDEDLVKILRSLDELISLQAIMGIDERLAVAAGSESQPSMYDLFYIVGARFTMSLDDEAEGARYLRNRLTLTQRAVADRGLMENQRRALVAFFLQQDYMEELGIRDADGIFEYFLIDSQMGPQLKTSRIKQAISVVQLFAQRTILGLERDVLKTSLVREQWEWRQQYSLWEAYVKMFLYPENWLEPSLRDDKSQLFEDFESSLMKKNLSLETFNGAIKTYVYGLNRIADLEVAAYIREPSGGTDIFHLFGRTRYAPYSFYHRTLTTVRGDTVGVFWRPWTKIEMDIPAVETSWEGQRLDITSSHLIPVWIGGRLYIFMPQITPKSAEKDDISSSDLDNKDFGELSNTRADVAKPKRLWEVSMAWTELSRGTWAPKRVSAGTLTLEAALPKPNALRFEPKFDAETTSTRVTLVAGYPLGSNSNSYQVFGAFSFCNDQITPLIKEQVTFPLTQRLYDATFQQELQTDASKIKAGTPLANASDPKPYFWLPAVLVTNDESKKIKTASWTLSYSTEEGPTSLSLSTRRLNETCASFFSVPKRAIIRLRDWPADQLEKQTETVAVDHTFSHTLMKAAAIKSDSPDRIFGVLTTQPKDELSAAFGNTRTDADTQAPIYHELARPAALYNWEIGLHAVLLAMDRFQATQQFDEALQVARLVFDPTVDVRVEQKPSSGTAEEPAKMSCWKFPPFQQIAEDILQQQSQVIKLGDITKDKDFNLAIMERLNFGALVHATARGRPEAYMKWIVMKYAEILVAAGDVYFRRSTLESLPLAIQRYVEASHILGPEPHKIPKLGKKPLRTFSDLQQEDVEIELELPFSPELKRKDAGSGGAGQGSSEIVCHLRTTYFCVPLNPKFKTLRTTVNNRLFNIRNSLDINGVPVTYALLEPSIDPGDLIALSSQGLSMSEALTAVLASQDSPLPRQRFETLLRFALDLCSELRTLGSRMLAAIETREAAAFTELRARHATSIQKKMLDIRMIGLEESEKSIEALQIVRDRQVAQLEFYLALIGEPNTLIPKSATDTWTNLRQDIDTPTKDDLRMSSNEKMEMDLSDAAGALKLVAEGIDGLISPLFAIPDIEANTQPMGMGASVSAGGKNAAFAVGAASTFIKTGAGILELTAKRASKKADLTKQLQDRRFQANVLGRDIKGTDKQIEIEKIKARVIQKEIELRESELEEAVAIETWHRTKYTNEQLYSWMEKNLRSLYYQAYTMAMSAARKAESALTFEKGQRVTLLRPAGYWDSSRDGLMSGDHLYLDLKRLESAYAEIYSDYTITKTVSLRQIDPLALLNLRLKGSCVFSVSENQFDMDFPGHYFRRITSVSMSIPAIVGPNCGVNATLQLTGHKYRTSPIVAKADEYAAQNRDAFRTDRIPITAAAVSANSSTAAAFDFTFSDVNSYGPFEGAGAISSWRLDLPEVRKFDYESISDVLLHIRYLSSEGGVTLKTVASQAVRDASKVIDDKGRGEGFWAMLDLRNDFAGEWNSFQSQLAGGADTGRLRLGNLRDRLSFWSRQQAKLKVRSLMWVSKNKTLTTNVDVNGVPKPGDADIQNGSIGASGIKTWSGLDVDKLDGWELTAPKSVLQEGEKKLDNMYMLMHYVFG